MSSAKPWERSDRIAAASAVLALLAIGVTVAPLVHEQLTEPTVEITAPVDDQRVTGQLETIEGESDDLGGDRDVWLVVRPVATTRYWPTQILTIQDDGSWSAVSDYVDLAQVGEYKLLVYYADSEASAFLQAYVDENVDVAEPPGIPSMPSGAELLHSVTVSRTS
ncbi:hypothetical protein ACI780_09140 [Geodermatophilus sp. SYSU D00814]